jgi:hypothetical protein
MFTFIVAVALLYQRAHHSLFVQYVHGDGSLARVFIMVGPFVRVFIAVGPFVRDFITHNHYWGRRTPCIHFVRNISTGTAERHVYILYAI